MSSFARTMLSLLLISGLAGHAHGAEPLSLARLTRPRPALGVGKAVDVNLVLLYASVTTREGAPVTRFKKEDFELTEDDVPQTVSHLSRRRVPLSIVLVFDLSFSMMGSKVALGVDVARSLVTELAPDDRLAFVAFDEQILASLPFTTHHELVSSRLGELDVGGGTALFDTLLCTLDDLAAEPGKRVIIVVSDGEDYHSTVAIEDVMDRAAETQTLMYSIGIVGSRLGAEDHWSLEGIGPEMAEHWSDRLRLRGTEFLRQLSAGTGGLLYMPRGTQELPAICHHIYEDLKNQYELGFYSTNGRRDGRFRRLRLKVAAQGYETRLHSGYFAPRPTGRPE